MKRMTALLLTLALCLSMLPAAYAADPKLESFTYKAAMNYISEMEWEGVSVNVKEAKMVFWVPNTLARIEPPEDMVEAGVVKAYAAQDLVVQVVMADYGEETLEEYLEAAKEEKCKKARIEQVNDVDWLIFDREMEGVAVCRVAAAKLPDGQFVEVFYYALNSKLSNMINASIATLRFRK